MIEYDRIIQKVSKMSKRAEMNLKMADILRFLFPELQIRDAVREQGFIARRRRDNRESTETDRRVSYQGNTAVQQRMDSALNTAAYTPEDMHRMEQRLYASSRKCPG